MSLTTPRKYTVVKLIESKAKQIYASVYDPCIYRSFGVLGVGRKSGAQELHGGLRSARGERVEYAREAHVFRPVEAVMLPLAHHRNELVAREEAVAYSSKYYITVK